MAVIGGDDDATLADAQFAITQFSSWITNADTKAGLLATATSVVVAALVAQRDRFIGKNLPLHVSNIIALVLACAALAAAATAIVAIVLAVRPRIDRSVDSRFSWPTVEMANADDLVHLGDSGRAGEAWETARILARITKAKLRWLNVGFIAWSIGLALSFAAVLPSAHP